VAETSFTIPGTQVKLPKWALLAGAAGLAGVLLLRPKGQASGAEIDQSEGSLGEAEGSAGGGGSTDNMQAILDAIAALQQQAPVAAMYPATGGYYAGPAWDSGLLAMETPSPGSPHASALIREEESPFLISGIGDTLATGTRVTQAEKREQRAVMTGKRGQRDAARATRDITTPETRSEATRRAVGSRQVGESSVVAGPGFIPQRSQMQVSSSGGSFISTLGGGRPERPVSRRGGPTRRAVGHYRRTARGTRIYRRPVARTSRKGTYAT